MLKNKAFILGGRRDGARQATRQACSGHDHLLIIKIIEKFTGRYSLEQFTRLTKGFEITIDKYTEKSLRLT